METKDEVEMESNIKPSRNWNSKIPVKVNTLERLNKTCGTPKGIKHPFVSKIPTSTFFQKPLQKTVIAERPKQETLSGLNGVPQNIFSNDTEGSDLVFSNLDNKKTTAYSSNVFGDSISKVIFACNGKQKEITEFNSCEHLNSNTTVHCPKLQTVGEEFENIILTHNRDDKQSCSLEESKIPSSMISDSTESFGFFVSTNIPTREVASYLEESYYTCDVQTEENQMFSELDEVRNNAKCTTTNHLTDIEKVGPLNTSRFSRSIEPGTDLQVLEKVEYEFEMDEMHKRVQLMSTYEHEFQSEESFEREHKLVDQRDYLKKMIKILGILSPAILFYLHQLS